MTTLFIFHRDLRKEDNIGLIKSIQQSTIVYPIFIFTSDQVTSKNKYKSDRSVQFMVESLQHLEKSVPVSFFYGDTHQIVAKLLKSNIGFTHFSFNKDFTPYALKRDTKLIKLAQKMGIEVTVYDDITLHPMENCLKKDETPYKIFTPYFNNASKLKVDKPVKWMSSYQSKCKKISGTTLKSINTASFYEPLEIEIKGGRIEGLKILSKITKWSKYNTTRNFPEIPTTQLSPHLKFGTISIRETYHQFKSKLGSRNELVKQLFWRDFYMTMLFYFPDYHKSVTKPQMNNIKWNYSTHLSKWKKGTTGIPIVDAGMRQLNQTGYMHGRVRMIVATFLIYNLGINWKEGEKYFSQKLVDADVANNLGNWKWVAGIESYSNDYYKAMSMTSQMERFDPDCNYIKTWCPELEEVPPKDIINWETKWEEYKEVKYPKPIVDTKTSRQEMINEYKKALKG